MRDLTKGQEALRRGRHSLEGASYFLTVCFEDERTGLDKTSLADEIVTFARDRLCGWKLRTLVVMPDHVHLVAELLSNYALPDAVRLFKGRTADGLRRRGLKWQRGYYDHRMRPHEDARPVFSYIFLNPYWAGLLSLGHLWSGYYCSTEDWAWFGPLTNESYPLPEWVT